MRTNPIPFDRFITEVLRLYDPPHRAAATRRQMRYVLEQVAHLGIKTTADLTPALIARFIEARPPGQSPRTLQSYLRVLRGICNQAVITGSLRISPFALRRVSQWLGRIGPPAEKKHYSRDEIRRVLSLMDADIEITAGWSQWRARRLYALTATVGYCGLRASEALYLHAADIKLEERYINLTDRGRDGGRALKTEASARPVPIPDALVPILQDWLSHRLDHPADFEIPPCEWLFPTLNRKGPWTGGPPGTKPVQRLQAVAARAGVEGMTLQSLRRSLATHLEHHGTGQAMITRILRHTDSKTTLTWYQQADIPNMVQAMASFDF